MTCLLPLLLPALLGSAPAPAAAGVRDGASPAVHVHAHGSREVARQSEFAREVEIAPAAEVARAAEAARAAEVARDAEMAGKREVAREPAAACDPEFAGPALPPSRPPALGRVRPGTSAGLDTARGKKIVILDAGHGGRDPGRDGPDGVLEKTVTLQLVRRLAGELRDRGYEVHLTRDADTLISLADRPRRANDWKRGRPQAVFVSVHANGGVQQASGFETFFLSDARTADERRVAEMENAAADYEEHGARTAPAVDRILESLRNDYYVRASDDLAELVQRHLATVHPGPNRGVKQAGFRVLVGAIMPAVLVETGFITNRGEERLLASSAFQRKLTGALADALDVFFARHAWAAGAGQ